MSMSDKWFPKQAFLHPAAAHVCPSYCFWDLDESGFLQAPEEDKRQSTVTKRTKYPADA